MIFPRIRGFHRDEPTSSNHRAARLIKRGVVRAVPQKSLLICNKRGVCIIFLQLLILNVHGSLEAIYLSD